MKISISGTRPYGGLNPTTPQNEDGILIEPPMSEPVASAAVPAASAAADPPLDPPGEYCVFHGLRVTPQSLDQVTGAQLNSGVVVLACTMPPASMIRCTKALVCVRDVVAQRQRPERVALAGDLGLLLHRHRQALERPRRPALARITGLRRPGPLQRLVEEGLGERVDHRLDCLGALDHRRDQLDR